MEKPEHIKHDEAERAEILRTKARIKRQISKADASPTSDALVDTIIRRVTSSHLAEAALKDKIEEEDEEEEEDKKASTETDKEKKKEEEPRAPIGRILQLSKPEWPGMFVGALFTLLSVIPESLTPALFGQASKALSTDGMQGVNFWMSAVILLAVASAVLGFVKTYIFGVAGERVVVRLRQQLLSAIISSDISKLDKTQSGEFVSRLTTDVMSVQGVATTALVTMFTNVCSLAVSLTIMFKLSWQLTVMLLVCVPVFIGVIIPLSKVSGKFASAYQSGLAEATSIAQETIANFRTVRAFAAEKHSANRYKESLGDLKNTRCWWMKDACVYRLGIQKALFQAGFEPSIGLMFSLVIYGSLWFALYLASLGKFDIGLIFTFMMYSFQMMGKFGAIGGTFGQLVSASVAAGKIFQIIDTKPEIPVKGGKRPELVQGLVTFEDVHFTYPGTSEAVLTGLNCTVPPQTSAAFVGQSGCGKSTTLRLLERFYDVSQGKVCIDGNDVRELDGSWIRMNVAFVQQEPNLFAMSVRDNVAYSQMVANANLEPIDTVSEAATTLTSVVGESEGEAKDDKIIEACKLANAHDFIQNLENKYDTMVGERGMKLSGGQKQRVAIARAIIKDPKIMLLDEATSALDSESEALVSEAINNMMKGRTVLLVAHRLSTVRDATSIHYVRGGKVLASGSHSNLLYECPEYKHLVEHQMA